MGRHRIYANAAERQKAHRERTAAPRQAPVPNAKQRVLSRPMRLAAIITSVKTLQQEYQQWLDRLPEFQEGSEQEAKLVDTIELLEQALELLNEIQPPKGFGRD